MEKYNIRLELGDIIKIKAPSNNSLHERTFYVSYINVDEITTWIDIDTFETYTIQMNNNGFDSDASIENIDLLNRSAEKGYARQNGLVIGVWIDIHLGDDVPSIITGCITDTNEDMIEITTYVPEHEGDKLYIDFKYQGIPRDIPIKQICIRESPLALKSKNIDTEQVENEDDYDSYKITEPQITYNDDGTVNIEIPDNYDNPNFRNDINTLLQSNIDVDDFYGSNDSDNDSSLPIKMQLYNLQAQLNHLYDDFLSRIPDNAMTYRMVNIIKTHVFRFEELRSKFSQKTHEGDIIGKIRRKNAKIYRPLLDNIFTLHDIPRWIIPIVSQKKNVYDTLPQSSDIQVINHETSDDTASEIIKENNLSNQLFYNNYYKGDSENINYESMYEMTQDYLKPFDNSGYDNLDYISIDASSDIDMIVSNFENGNGLYSSISKSSYKNVKGQQQQQNVKNDVEQQKFVTQRYNNKIYYSAHVGKNKTEKKILFQSDKAHIHSLLFLSEGHMNFSRAHLPNSSILLKSNTYEFSRYPYISYGIRTKNYSIYDRDENAPLFPDLKYMQLLKIFDKSNESYDLNSKNHTDKYSLEKIKRTIGDVMPNAFSVIEKYISKNSACDVSTYLQFIEPFLYYSDNITSGVLKKIRYFVNKNRIKYMNSYNNIIREWQKYQDKEFKPRTIKRLPLIHNKTFESLLKTESDLNDTFTATYNYKNDKTSSELLKYIYLNDDASLFTSLLNYIDIELTNSEDFFKDINAGVTENNEESVFIKPMDCFRKRIVKTYNDVKTMEGDNGSELIEVESKYDNIKYDIMNNYYSEKENMKIEDFKSFLAEQLVKKHGCPSRLSTEITETIIRGKNYIKDGEYAMLMIEPTLPNGIKLSELNESEIQEIEIEKQTRKKVSYYVRLKNRWIHDKNVTEDSFFDTASIFCNLNENNQKTNLCEDINIDTKERLVKEEKQKLKNELISRHDKSIDISKENVQQRIKYFENILEKVKIIQYNRLNSVCKRQYNIGKNLDKNDKLISPNWSRRYSLLHHSVEFSEKQNNIIKFYNYYCREPFHKENTGWKYCRETDTQLLETSLYDLAIAFQDGKYIQELQSIKKKFGTISEDGKYAVDKRSMCVLEMLEYSEDGTLLSSFQKEDEENTDDLFDDDYNNGESTKINKVKTKMNKYVYDDSSLQRMYQIISAICDKVFVPISIVEETSMRICIQLLKSKKLFLNEKTYKIQQDKAKQKEGVKLMPYKDFLENKMIDVASSSFLIAIQTLYPSFHISKYERNCVASFKGYPLGTADQQDGIKYISCVLRVIKLGSKKMGEMEKRILRIIDNYILISNDNSLEFVKNLINEKRDYIKENETTEQNFDSDINIKWEAFVPPTRSIVIMNESRPLSYLSKEFEEVLVKDITNKSRDQWETFSVYMGKVQLYGYALLQLLENILQKKDNILNTMTQVPYQQNACCNEITTNKTTLLYFISEEPKILSFIQNSKMISSIIKKYKHMKKGFMIRYDRPTSQNTDKENLKPKNINSHKNIQKDLMYKIFIYYCKYDNNTSVLPEDLKNICSERPMEYDSTASLEQKIELLSVEGKKVTSSIFIDMMNAIYKRNNVVIESKIEYEWKQNFIEELQTIQDAIKGKIDYQDIIDLFSKILEIGYDTDDNNSDSGLDTNKNMQENMIMLNNKVASITSLWEKSISSFIKDNVQSMNTVSKQRVFSTFISTLFENENLSEQTLQNTLLSLITHYSIIFPSFIGTSNMQSIGIVSKQWDLTAEDVKSYEGYYKNVFQDLSSMKGSGKNEKLTVLLNTVMTHSKPLMRLFDNIPSLIELLNADRKTTVRFYKFLTLLSLQIYITLSSDNTVIIEQAKYTKNLEKEENKQMEYNDIEDDFEDEIEDITDEFSKIAMTKEKSNIQELVGDLIISYIKITSGKSSQILYKSYDDILSIMNRSKEIEKNKVKKYFANLQKQGSDVLKAEILAKRMRLGKYYINQKDLITYGKNVKDFFDVETNAKDIVINAIQNEIDFQEDENGVAEGSNELDYNDDMTDDENNDDNDPIDSDDDLGDIYASSQ